MAESKPTTELVDHDGNPLPPAFIKGKYNPKHLQAKARALTDLMHKVAVGQMEMPKGMNCSQAMDLLVYEAKHNGLDPKHALDVRTDEQIVADAVDKLCEDPETLDQLTDSELELTARAIREQKLDETQKFQEEEFRNAVTLVDGILQERIKEGKVAHGTDGYTNVEVRLAERKKRGKLWLSRIEREMRLREWIRTRTVPKGENPAKATAFQAAKPLFFMVKVFRSNTTSQLRPGSDCKVYRIGMCHATFAMDTFEARHGLRYGAAGVEYNFYEWMGVMLLAHPGTGKTDYVMAYTTLEISENFKTQAAWLHAKSDKACEHKKHISDTFDNSNAVGRRRNAIYPSPGFSRRDNNASTMRLNVDGIKSPTLQASGVTSAGLSGNTNFQVWDDVVPTSDRDQPTERERRITYLRQTWFTRQRGRKTFIIFSGYPFHNDDAVSVYRRDSDNQGEGRRRLFLTSEQKAGGPNTTPKFKSICPEMYSSEDLAAKFNQMGRNMNLWSANYMLNPIADESRLIRKLRFYDPEEAMPGQEPTEHDKFMAVAHVDITVDPTATNKETSDKAAVLRAALSQVRVQRPGTNFFEEETRLRFLNGARLHLNQIELGDELAMLAAGSNIDEVHLEIRSNSGTATRDYIEQKYGYAVTTHDPLIMNKGIRLKWVSALIDDSNGGAKVEFPGQWEEHDGERVLVCREDLRWLAKQLLDFGVESEDDGVDAVQQLVYHYMKQGVLMAGTGAATVAIQESLKQSGDPRMRAIVKQMFGDQRTKTAHQEDCEWMRRRWS